MISLKIEEVKAFMAMLLTNTLFDELILREMDIQTFTNFNVSGQFHENFFTKEELEERGSEKAVLWGDIRGIAFSIIRGQKSPLMMKIVFQLPSNQTARLLEGLGGKLRAEDVGGLYMNIRFEKNELHIITGTAIKTFTLDKTLDIEWDGWVKKFLSKQGIIFEEE
ncbi:MAG: hypothetical protein EWM47_02925 [Anaerolineaceae bacterium]|nr:MAG: hypothetical protein EWM47_02925 [Anaerolineaceae bacterium]